MNEKIKELAERAGFAYEPTKDQLWVDGPTEIMISPGLEKFAGLIQYEIIKVIEGCHYRNGIDSDHNKALNLAVEQIKQHFGFK